MPLPKFLIIGAMKAGTTTLYGDLGRQPGLFLPADKEPEDLVHPAAETEVGRAAYVAKFDRCPEGAMAGDASTAYTKRPTYDGVAERARAVLGPDVRIIYMIRHPLDRLVSQYHHFWGSGGEVRPLNQAVLEDETYVAYSRYAWQLAPWLAAFGDDRIRVQRFEDYLADRPQAFAACCAHLGIAPQIDPGDSHLNASDGKRVVREGSFLRQISGSGFYRQHIKPRIPTGLRQGVKSLLVPKARTVSETLSDATRAELMRRLADDSMAETYLDTAMPPEGA